MTITITTRREGSEDVPPNTLNRVESVSSNGLPFFHSSLTSYHSISSSQAGFARTNWRWYREYCLRPFLGGAGHVFAFFRMADAAGRAIFSTGAGLQYLGLAASSPLYILLVCLAMAGTLNTTYETRYWPTQGSLLSLLEDDIEELEGELSLLSGLIAGEDVENVEARSNALSKRLEIAKHHQKEKKEQAEKEAARDERELGWLKWGATGLLEPLGVCPEAWVKEKAKKQKNKIAYEEQQRASLGGLNSAGIKKKKTYSDLSGFKRFLVRLLQVCVYCSAFFAGVSGLKAGEQLMNFIAKVPRLGFFSNYTFKGVMSYFVAASGFISFIRFVGVRAKASAMKIFAEDLFSREYMATILVTWFIGVGGVFDKSLTGELNAQAALEHIPFFERKASFQAFITNIAAPLGMASAVCQFLTNMGSNIGSLQEKAIKSQLPFKAGKKNNPLYRGEKEGLKPAGYAAKEDSVREKSPYTVFGFNNILFVFDLLGMLFANLAGSATFAREWWGLAGDNIKQDFLSAKGNHDAGLGGFLQTLFVLLMVFPPIFAVILHYALNHVSAQIALYEKFLKGQPSLLSKVSSCCSKAPSSGEEEHLPLVALSGNRMTMYGSVHHHAEPTTVDHLDSVDSSGHSSGELTRTSTSLRLDLIGQIQ